MYAMGYTLNSITMLSLTLMVGIVIDDAIVVLENIYRFVEEKGMNPFQAAIEGTREIGMAVLATTLSLMAVFVPIGFMQGIVGKIYVELRSDGVVRGRRFADRFVYADADARGAADQTPKKKSEKPKQSPKLEIHGDGMLDRIRRKPSASAASRTRSRHRKHTSWFTTRRRRLHLAADVFDGASLGDRYALRACFSEHRSAVYVRR